MKTMVKPVIKPVANRIRRAGHMACKTTKFPVTENVTALCGKYREVLTETTEFLRVKHRETLQER